MTRPAGCDRAGATTQGELTDGLRVAVYESLVAATRRSSAVVPA